MLKAEFEQAVEDFLVQYPATPGGTGSSLHCRRARRRLSRGGRSCARKFGFGWHTFKVAGAASAAGRWTTSRPSWRGSSCRAEQLALMKQNLRAECQQFPGDYVMAFRKEVAEFCDQVIDADGKVHGKTLQAIRRKIEHFHAMNIFNDADTGGAAE